jgi:hypothetical protein
LKYRGEKVAEAWFKPEGDPFALTFRVPQRSFQLPGMGQSLTADNLLKAVGIATEEVESWHQEGGPDPGTGGPPSELGRPLPPPTQDVTHLILHVRLRPPRAGAPEEGREPEAAEEQWQGLVARWNAILKLEASLDSLRIGMEGLRAELEASTRGSLTPDERVHAMQADVAQWTKAKSRVHHALPKTRDFIHRSTWAAGTPERKELEELFKAHAQSRPPVPQMVKVAEQLDSLLKDRQVLSALGVSVFQECKSIAADVQGALRALRNNAAANAAKKRTASDARSRSFKRK